MALNEKLVTEDFVELQDKKVLAKEAHPEIFSSAREAYSELLGRLGLQILSPEQKAAMDATVTSPSVTNPVALKDDLPSYYQQADLGDIKDSVNFVSELPLTGNSENDIRAVLTEGTLYRWDISLLSWIALIKTGTLEHTQLSVPTLDANPAFQHLSATTKNLLKTESHTHPNPVVTVENLSVLDAITDAGSGIVITDDERLRIPSSDQKDALSGDPFDVGLPSGIDRIVTNSDPRLNTVTNPYVTVGHANAMYVGTDVQPFLDAVAEAKNGKVKAVEVFPAEYQMNGLGVFLPIVWDDNPVPIPAPPTMPSIEGVMTPDGLRSPFHGSFDPTIGYPTTLEYPSMISGWYFSANRHGTLSGVTYEAGDWAVYDGTSWVRVDNSGRNGGLLLECITPRGATLSFRSFMKSIQLLAGNGDVTLRGFVIEVEGNGTEAILADRKVLIENCTFKTKTTNTAFNHVAIRLNGAGSMIRNCIFNGSFVNAVIVSGVQCTVTDCIFDLDDPSLSALSVTGSANEFLAANNVFATGSVDIASAENVQFTKNMFSSFSSLTDSGDNTRWLLNQPLHYGQPFVGKRKTIGIPGSSADYQGVNEAAFIAALADPHATEIAVLEGLYSFTSTVTVPSGKRLRGVRQGLSGSELACTVSVSDPAVVSAAGNNYSENSPVMFTSSGTLPGLTAGRIYYVRNRSGSLFNISEVVGGDLVITSGIQSGVHAVMNAKTKITASTTIFDLSDDTTLHTLELSVSNADAVVASGDRVEIKRCVFNAQGAGRGLRLVNSDRSSITDCLFTGVTGIQVIGGRDALFGSNKLLTSDTSFQSDAAFLHSRFVDNMFMAGSVDINGVGLLVRGNDFSLGVPTKLGTTDSVWQGNTPPMANNEDGVDWLTIDMDGLIEPLPTGGTAFAPFLDGASLVFTNDVIASAATMPIRLTSKIDMTRNFSLRLGWTADAFSGSVVWEASVTFRDQTNKVIGSSIITSAVSDRTHLLVGMEETVQLPFTAYGMTTPPTHVSVILTRHGSSTTDTLPADVHLTNATLILPRD